MTEEYNTLLPEENPQGEDRQEEKYDLKYLGEM